MKITKRQLKRAIRKSLVEWAPSGGGKLGSGAARAKGDVIITSTFGIKNTNQLPARGDRYSVGDLVEYVVKKYKRNRPPKTGQGVIVDRYEKSGIVKVTIIPIADGLTINRRVSSINRAEEAVLSVVEPGWSPVRRGHSDDPDVDQGQNLTNPNRVSEMKITKRQLRKIIRESYDSWTDTPTAIGAYPQDVDPDDYLSDEELEAKYQQERESYIQQVMREESVGREEAIKLIDYWNSDDYHPAMDDEVASMYSYKDDPGVQMENFKITKLQLKQIIKEEYRKLLKESEQYIYRTQSGELRISDDDGNDEPYPQGEREYSHLQPGDGQTVTGGGRGYSRGGYSRRRRW